MRRLVAILAAWLALSAVPAAAERGFAFPSIDGGTLALDDWRGRPVLVVNTASLCAFTPQYEALQTLWERYRDDGLVVLAVPSDDFAQELGTDDEVRDFCELTYGLTLPMTTITPVRGADAHPFYRWLADEHGIRPRWNFHKVLLSGEGEPVADWGSVAGPLSGRVTGAIAAELAR